MTKRSRDASLASCLTVPCLIDAKTKGCAVLAVFRGGDFVGWRLVRAPQS